MLLKYFFILIATCSQIFFGSDQSSINPKELYTMINHGQILYLKNGNAFLNNPHTNLHAQAIGRLHKRQEEDEHYILTIITNNASKVCIDTIKSDQVIILDRLHIDPNMTI